MRTDNMPIPSTPPRHDVFICHASEDKDEFVRDLAHELVDLGLRVWYDEFSLHLGDSLRRSIDRGLTDSQFGVVILSPHFFAKEWPQRELDGLVAREIAEGKVLLPIWHKVGTEEVGRYSPVLVDRVAVSSAEGARYVASEIVRIVRPVPLKTVEIRLDILKRVSHELMLPISSIATLLEWLTQIGLRDTLSGASHRSVGRTLDECENILRHLAIFVEFISPPIAVASLGKQAVLLGEAVEDTLHLFSAQIARDHLQVMLDIDSNATVHASPRGLRLVLYALIGNCVEYCDRREASTVHIAARAVKHALEFSVADNGIGIVEGEEKSIFHRFVRGSNAATVAATGLGLGLPVARRIIDDHGGSIRLVTRAKPTVFVVRWPNSGGDEGHESSLD